MRHVRLAVLLLAALAVAGCARTVVPAAMAPGGPDDVVQGPPPPPPPPPVALVGGAPLPAYTLDSGDRLRVVVFGQESLTNR
jgi:polysaccharide biosynthesis/export protein